MKAKLFSKRSLLVSLKGLATYVFSSICTIPLWIIFWILINKQLMIIGGLFGLFSLVVSFLFFGYFGTRWWGWK